MTKDFNINSSSQRPTESNASDLGLSSLFVKTPNSKNSNISDILAPSSQTPKFAELLKNANSDPNRDLPSKAPNPNQALRTPQAPTQAQAKSSQAPSSAKPSKSDFKGNDDSIAPPNPIASKAAIANSALNPLRTRQNIGDDISPRDGNDDQIEQMLRQYRKNGANDEGNDKQELQAQLAAMFGTQTATNALPILSFLSGQLNQIQPSQIPELVSSNGFVSNALANADIKQFLNTPQDLGTLFSELGIDKKDQELASQLGINLSQNITPTAFLKSIGVDPARVSAELEILQNRLPLEGLQPYIQRATALNGGQTANSQLTNSAQNPLQSIPTRGDVTPSIQVIGQPASPQIISLSQGNQQDANLNSGISSPSELPLSSAKAKPAGFNAASFDSVQKDGNTIKSDLNGAVASSNNQISSNLLNTTSNIVGQDNILKSFIAAPETDAKTTLGAEAIAAKIAETTSFNSRIPRTDSTIESATLSQSQLPTELKIGKVDNNFAAQSPLLNPTKDVFAPIQDGTIAPQILANLTRLDMQDAAHRQNIVEFSSIDSSNQVGSILSADSLDSGYASELPIDDAADGTIAIAPNLSKSALQHFLSGQNSGVNPITKAATVLNFDDLANSIASRTSSLSRGEVGSLTDRWAEKSKTETEQPFNFAESNEIPVLSGISSFQNHIGAKSVNLEANGNISNQASEASAKLINQVIEKAQLALAKNNSSIRVDINTPDFGKVDLAVNLSNNRVHIKMLTDNEQLRDLIANEIPKLRDALGLQNLSLGSLDVGVGKHSSPGNNGFQQSDQQRHNPNAQHLFSQNSGSFGGAFNGANDFTRQFQNRVEQFESSRPNGPKTPAAFMANRTAAANIVSAPHNGRIQVLI